MIQNLDARLYETGLTQKRGNKTLVLACGALAREIIAICGQQGLMHLDLKCLPAILHNTPQKIPDAVRAAIEVEQDTYDYIFVAYADCGTGGRLKATCKDLGVQMLEGPHCYSFFEGNAIFAARDEITAFYLTDFLVRQFDAFVTLPLGLDKHPDLRDVYFAHYDTVVYLAQTQDDHLTAKAKQCAKRLGLKFERRFTGYGDLQNGLQNIMRI